MDATHEVQVDHHSDGERVDVNRVYIGKDRNGVYNCLSNMYLHISSLITNAGTDDERFAMLAEQQEWWGEIEQRFASWQAMAIECARSRTTR